MNTKKPTGVQEDQDSLLMEFYVQKVRNRLRQLNSPDEKDIKRWVWELSQNAKDSIAKSTEYDGVNIEIIKDENSVTFIHDGSPFNVKTLNRLIWQLSGEKDGVSGESIGRFGTGFLTTHTLSKIVSLESVMYDKDNQLWGTKLTMYREGDTKKLLQQEMDKTIASREAGYMENPIDKRTKFTYHLKQEINHKSAKEGIKSLKANVLYVLAFSPTIASFRLRDGNEIITYKKEAVETINEALQIQSIRFSITTSKGTDYKSILLCSSTEYNEDLSEKYQKDRSIRASIAILIDEDKKEILPIARDTPHLFCDFPLIGTEKFHLPFVLNSPDFEPTSERDGVFLSGADTEIRTKNEDDEDDLEQETDESKEIVGETIISLAGINKLILKKSVELYEYLLKYLINNNYSNRYLLAIGAKDIPKHDDVDKEWYKENIQSEFRALVTTVPLVKTYDGYQPIQNEDGEACVIFPQGSTKTERMFLFMTSKELYPNRIPQESLIEEWSKLIWKEDCHFQTAEQLVKNISDFETLDELPVKEDKVAWLNNVIEYYYDSDEHLALLNDYAIIPNQKGEFQFANYEDFSIDDNLPQIGIEVLKMLDIDWKEILLHKGITKSKITHKKTVANLVNLVNSKLEAKVNNNEDVKEIMFLLVSIFPLQDDNNIEFLVKRQALYSFSKSLFGEEIPEKQVFSNLPDKLWSYADDWLIKHILEKVASFEKVENLVLYNEEDIIEWLNKLIKYVGQHEKIELLSNDTFKVLPNQEGIFCLKQDLSKDIDIPEELKVDLLSGFGLELKANLLHNDITVFTPEKTTAIKNVVDDLNQLIESKIELIDEKNQSIEEKNLHIKELEQVIFYLTTLSSEQENSNREIIFSFVKNLFYNEFKDVEGFTTIKNSDKGLWRSVDEWLIKHILKKVASYENIDSLILQDIEDKVKWLDNLICYILELQKVELLNEEEFKVLPNQNGVFCLKSNLSKDVDIPEELKVPLLNDFGLKLKDQLLHKGIKALTPESNITIPNVVTDLDKLIDSQLETIEKNENESSEQLEKVVFYLTRLSPNISTPSYNKRVQIFSFAKDLFSTEFEEVENITSINNSVEGLWIKSDKYLFQKIVEKLESLKPDESNNSLELLEILLEGADNSPIQWINGLIKFMDTYQFKLGEIIPNQNGNFCVKRNLHRDGNIPEDLKNILELLDFDKDYKHILIHSEIDGIKPDNTRYTKDIAPLITQLIRGGFSGSNRYDEDYKKAIKLLVIDWFNKDNPYPQNVFESSISTVIQAHTNLFSWVYENRYKLETEVLTSIEDRKRLYELSSRVSAEVQQKILDNPQIISENEALKKENEALKKELEQYKNAVGTVFSGVVASKDTVNNDNVEIERLRARIVKLEAFGQLDGNNSTMLPNSDFIEQLKRNSEFYLYKLLQNKFSNHTVKWLNYNDNTEQYQESFQNHDFEIIDDDNNNILHYIECKSTPDIKRTFYMTENEWSLFTRCIREGKSYQIYRVYNLSTDTQCFCIENLLEWIKQEKIVPYLNKTEQIRGGRVFLTLLTAYTDIKHE